MLRVQTTLSGFAGGPGLMTNYFTSGAYDVATATRVRDRVQALLSSGLRTVLWNDVTWSVHPEVDVISPDTGQITDTFSINTAQVGVGTAGANAAPIAAAALVRWGTDTYIAGRRLRGRSFISPLAADAIGTDGEIKGGIASGMDTHLAAFIAVPTEGDAAVVWHRPVSGSGGSAGQITSGLMPLKVAVLTSRRD